MSVCGCVRVFVYLYVDAAQLLSPLDMTVRASVRAFAALSDWCEPYTQCVVTQRDRFDVVVSPSFIRVRGLIDSPKVGRFLHRRASNNPGAPGVCESVCASLVRCAPYSEK